MIDLTVSCTDCPYNKVCIARVNDSSIIGCGIPLYVDGIIPYACICVRHKLKLKEGDENAGI